MQNPTDNQHTSIPSETERRGALVLRTLPIQSQRVRLMPCRRRESVVVAIPCVPFQN